VDFARGDCAKAGADAEARASAASSTTLHKRSLLSMTLHLEERSLCGRETGVNLEGLSILFASLFILSKLAQGFAPVERGPGRIGKLSAGFLKVRDRLFQSGRQNVQLAQLQARRRVIMQFQGPFTTANGPLGFSPSGQTDRQIMMRNAEIRNRDRQRV